MTGEKVDVGGLMSGGWAPTGPGGKAALLGLIQIQRPFVALMGPMMFFAGMMLAASTVPSGLELMVAFIAVYLLTSAEHGIDDLIDKERDRVKWPRRAIPSGLISKGAGAAYVLTMAVAGLLLSYVFFNWQLVAVELLALGLGTLYPFMRDKLGYLVLIPIPALIGIGGWVSVSPGNLFASPVPWLLYLAFASWQGFHILATPWAIKKQKTFVVQLSPDGNARLSFAFSVFHLVVACLLILAAGFHLAFLIFPAALMMMFWGPASKMVKDPHDDKNVFGAFKAATMYCIFFSLGVAVIAAVW